MPKAAVYDYGNLQARPSEVGLPRNWPLSATPDLRADFPVIVFMAVVVAMLTPPLLKVAFRGVLASPPPEAEVFRPA